MSILPMYFAHILLLESNLFFRFKLLFKGYSVIQKLSKFKYCVIDIVIVIECYSNVKLYSLNIVLLIFLLLSSVIQMLS